MPPKGLLEFPPAPDLSRTDHMLVGQKGWRDVAFAPVTTFVCTCKKTNEPMVLTGFGMRIMCDHCRTWFFVSKLTFDLETKRVDLVLSTDISERIPV